MLQLIILSLLFCHISSSTTHITCQQCIQSKNTYFLTTSGIICSNTAQVGVILKVTTLQKCSALTKSQESTASTTSTTSSTTTTNVHEWPVISSYQDSPNLISVWSKKLTTSVPTTSKQAAGQSESWDLHQPSTSAPLVIGILTPSETTKATTTIKSENVAISHAQKNENQEMGSKHSLIRAICQQNTVFNEFKHRQRKKKSNGQDLLQERIAKCMRMLNREL